MQIQITKWQYGDREREAGGGIFFFISREIAEKGDDDVSGDLVIYSLRPGHLLFGGEESQQRMHARGRRRRGKSQASLFSTRLLSPAPARAPLPENRFVSPLPTLSFDGSLSEHRLLLLLVGLKQR